MDQALRNKIVVYPTPESTSESMSVEERGRSTLIEAGVALFHAMPDSPSGPDQVEDLAISQYELGFQEGEARANALHESAIEIMQEALDKIHTEYRGLVTEIERSHVSAVAKCLRIVFPTLMDKGIDIELQTIVKNACGAALNGTVQLLVHPDALPHCERLSGDQDIHIITDETLAPKQMRLNWTGGGADIDCESFASRCLACITSQPNNQSEPNDA